MCGIFGYYNYRPRTRRQVVLNLLNGLRRLEYRGYDSAGFCIDGQRAIFQKYSVPLVVKSKGKVQNVADKAEEVIPDELMDQKVRQHAGISHTRWATHGPPSDVNSHPQVSDERAEFAVCHNGTITNFRTLKEFLISKGNKFVSETDTEVIAQLLKYVYEQHVENFFKAHGLQRDQDAEMDTEVDVDFPELVIETLNMLEGAYALLIKSTHYPGQMMACKKGSPLILGIRQHEINKDEVDSESLEFGAVRSKTLEYALKSPVTLNVVKDGAFGDSHHSQKGSFRLGNSGHRSNSTTLEQPLGNTMTSDGHGTGGSREYKKQVGAVTVKDMSEGAFLQGLANSEDPEVRKVALQNLKLQKLQENEYFVSSDASAIVEHTNQVMYLKDYEMAHIFNGEHVVYQYDPSKGMSSSIQKQLEILDIEVEQIGKGGYPYFMEKEINEQPETIMQTMRGRVMFNDIPKDADPYTYQQIVLGGIKDNLATIQNCSRLVFVACGTSYNATLAARQTVEEMINKPVQLELASDIMDRQNIYVQRNDCFIFVSQSGETKDTMEALELIQRKGALLVGITNTVGSSISRATDCGIHVNAGPEIGVASTKAYTSQIVAMTMMALQLSVDSVSLSKRRQQIVHSLRGLPDAIKQVLKTNDVVKQISRDISDQTSFLVFGRGNNYATALECALKVKELTYIHSEGLLAGEMKHGPLALVDEHIQILVVVTRDSLYEKMKGIIEILLARHGNLICMISEGDKELKDYCNEKSKAIKSKKPIRFIEVPTIDEALQPIVNIVPLQLLSYHTTVARAEAWDKLMAQKGVDTKKLQNPYNPDQPRNLAKSVTVTE